MKTIKKLILFLILMSTLVFALSTSVTMEIYKKVLFQNTYETAVGSIRQIEFNLNEKTDTISKTIIKVLSGEELKELANVEDPSSPYAYEKINNFNKEVVSILNYSKEFASILYVDQTEFMVGTDGETVWREPVQENLSNKINEILERENQEKSPIWIGGFSTDLFYQEKPYLRKAAENYITIVIPCKFSQNPLREGVLLANVRESTFRNIFSATMEKNRGEIYIIQEEGEIISSTRSDLINEPYQLYDRIDRNQKQQYFTEEEVYVISYEIEDSGWWVVWERPLDYFYSEAEQLYRILIYFVLLSLLLVFAFYGIYTKSLLKPLHTLIRAMEDLGKGRYGTKVEDIPKGEIGNVIQSFNEMSEDLELLTKENIRVNNEKRTLQLLALQEQMSPHFVLNALNTIKWMATLAKEKNIIDMVISLSKIIYAFKNTSAFESIEEELDFIKNYIKVMNYRYGDVIQIYYDIEESLLSMAIPIFFIQPLVENALKHGFAATNCQGEIGIKIHKEEDLVKIEVTDNGSGMEEQKREELNQKLGMVNQSPFLDTGGVGLINIAKRIQIYYGSLYGIKMEERECLGTKVTITLPYETETVGEE